MSAAQRLRDVQDRIRRAADLVNRNPDDITLIAVSKTRTVDEIKELVDLGVQDFGESKVQEAIPKVEAFTGNLRWHFIGHLQSNKAKKCAEYFPFIHSISSENQLREIEKGNRDAQAFIEVNLARELQKSGIFPETLDQFWKSTLQYKRTLVRGLMTIGPQGATEARTRALFRQLAELSQACGLPWLSMGMSSDFELGIQEGATHIRVGTALFGARGE